MSLGFKRLNGLLFGERRNLVSAHVPSGFKRTLLQGAVLSQRLGGEHG